LGILPQAPIKRIIYHLCTIPIEQLKAYGATRVLRDEITQLKQLLKDCGKDVGAGY